MDGEGIPTLEIDLIESVTIPGLTPRELILGESPLGGVVLSIEIESDRQEIQYDLYIDNVKWSFNVATMVHRLIQYPRFPGGWIARAAGGVFVFVFSGGVSGLQYSKNIRLVAKATSANNVIIAGGEMVRRICP